MNTQKVAITMPENLVKKIDMLRKDRGLSRSRFITLTVSEKIEEGKKRHITEAYDRIFSDEAVQKEQLETAGFFNRLGNEEGQEW